MNRRIQFIAAAFALAWGLPGFVYAQNQKTASLQYHLQDGRLTAERIYATGTGGEWSE